MSEGLLLAVAVAAGLACPAHMWWQHRRDRQAACSPPLRRGAGPSDLEDVQARQQRLARLIAEHGAPDEVSRS